MIIHGYDDGATTLEHLNMHVASLLLASYIHMLLLMMMMQHQACGRQQ
jgi:hypothetical protein